MYEIRSRLRCAKEIANRGESVENVTSTARRKCGTCDGSCGATRNCGNVRKAGSIDNTGCRGTAIANSNRNSRDTRVGHVETGKCGHDLIYWQYNRCCRRETRYTTDEQFATLVASLSSLPFSTPSIRFTPDSFVQPQHSGICKRMLVVVIGAIQIDSFEPDLNSLDLFLSAILNVDLHITSFRMNWFFTLLSVLSNDYVTTLI